MTSESNNNHEFIREQYSQYWEMMRFHLNLSWQIPALALAGVVVFLAFDPAKLRGWRDIPLVPAVTFLVVGLFILVMYVHHRRNQLFVKRYEQVVADFEETYGVPVPIHHFQLQGTLKPWQRISSSDALSSLLLLVAIGSLCTSFWFFTIALG